MDSALAGWLQLGLLVLALAVCYKPVDKLGNFWVDGLVIPFIGIRAIDLIIQFIPGFGG